MTQKEGNRTEDELLGRGKHVQGESDFVLVAFPLEPPDQIRGIRHCGRRMADCVAMRERPGLVLLVMSNCAANPEGV